MKNQGGGHIIGIASGSSFRGFIDEVIYCAGKHGVEGFVKALAFEAAPYNIALNTIGPGKPIKPTGVGQSEVDRMSDDEKVGWTDPIELGKAFVWLANQPPGRYTGLRFDAGPIADAIAAEGWDFEFHPRKSNLPPRRRSGALPLAVNSRQGVDHAGSTPPHPRNQGDPPPQPHRGQHLPPPP